MKLDESTIKNRFITKPPDQIIDDSLREQYGTELIAPHKVNRKRPKTQDGRVLRRYVPPVWWWLLDKFQFTTYIQKTRYFHHSYLQLSQLCQHCD